MIKINFILDRALPVARDVLFCTIYYLSDKSPKPRIVSVVHKKFRKRVTETISTQWSYPTYDESRILKKNG